MHLPSRMDVVQAGRPPVRVSLCSTLAPTRMDLCSLPRQRSSLGQVAEAGATAREGGEWRYISLQKRRLACHVTRNQIQGQSQRQCSRSGAAVVAWRVVSDQQGGVREWVSGAVNCLS